MIFNLWTGWKDWVRLYNCLCYLLLLMSSYPFKCDLWKSHRGLPYDFSGALSLNIDKGFKFFFEEKWLSGNHFDYLHLQIFFFGSASWCKWFLENYQASDNIWHTKLCCFHRGTYSCAGRLNKESVLYPKQCAGST